MSNLLRRHSVIICPKFKPGKNCWEDIFCQVSKAKFFFSKILADPEYSERETKRKKDRWNKDGQNGL